MSKQPDMAKVVKYVQDIYETLERGDELEWAMAITRLAATTIQSQAQVEIGDDDVQQTSILTASPDGVMMLQLVDDIFAITEYSALCGMSEVSEGDMCSIAIPRKQYNEGLQVMAGETVVDKPKKEDDNTPKVVH